VQFLIAASLAGDIEAVVYEAARILFYPILLLTLACLVWVLVELGYFLYEAYQRFRYRDLEALEIRTLKARDAFYNDRPRRAYRYLQENNYSIVVARFLFDLIRNYQTQRLAEKPLKLLQEYEFFTIRRLERTRILVRVGPLLGLMGALIALAPALQDLGNGDIVKLSDQLTVAFSVTVLGLLIGGLAFVISIVRDRFYSQDISDLEYLLEMLEGDAPTLCVGKPRRHKGEIDAFADDLSDDDPTAIVTPDAAPERTPGVPADGAPAATAPPVPLVRPIPVVPGFEPASEVAPEMAPETAPDTTTWSQLLHDGALERLAEPMIENTPPALPELAPDDPPPAGERADDHQP